MKIETVNIEFKGELSMCRSGRNKMGLKILVIGLSFAFAIPGFSSELKSARIYPTGKITIYNGDQKVGEFSKEAPFPDGFLIAAEGRCGVKMENVYLVAEDSSLFSVASAANLRELVIQKGTVYFAVSNNSPSLSFVTPDGTLAVVELLLNAATGNSQLKGYVSVKNDGSEIGVIRGGAMIVSTHDGEMIIESGQRLILAQADMDVGAPEELETGDEDEGKPEELAKEKKTGLSRNTKIILGVIGGGVVLGGFGALAAGGAGGGGGGGTVSPSSPTP
jgi:hypothetical protein